MVFMKICLGVALQSLLPYFGLPCCVVPFLHRNSLFKVGGCLFDKPRGTHDKDLADNTCFQLLGLKILFRFFGFENRRSPGWLRVSCTERGFSYLLGNFSGIVLIIINSFALSCCCSLDYYCVEPFVFE
jgi:hypothetical protein